MSGLAVGAADGFVHRFWAVLVALLVSITTVQAAAQTPLPATPQPAADAANTYNLTERERSFVRGAVRQTGDSYERNRKADGVGNLIGGGLAGGLGMYLYLSQDDITVRLIGLAIAFSALPQFVQGAWNIFYPTSQEQMADKILADDRLVDTSGILFVEQEARRAKRQRLVGGTTSIVSGAATLGTYFLLQEFLVTGPDNILLIFFIAGASIQVVNGVISLVSKSGAERSYQQMINALGRDPTAPRTNPNRISRARVTPTLLADEGRLVPALGMAFQF